MTELFFKIIACIACATMAIQHDDTLLEAMWFITAILWGLLALGNLVFNSPFRRNQPTKDD